MPLSAAPAAAGRTDEKNGQRQQQRRRHRRNTRDYCFAPPTPPPTALHTTPSVCLSVGPAAPRVKSSLSVSEFVGEPVGNLLSLELVSTLFVISDRRRSRH